VSSVDGADAAQEQQLSTLGKCVQQHAWPKRSIFEVGHVTPRFPSILVTQPRTGTRLATM
jgi:hypothetical protein